MTTLGVLQILVFFAVILAVTKPLGAFMTRLFAGERTFLHPLLRPVERLIYVLGGVDEKEEQRWTKYTASLLSFSLFSFVVLYLLQRLQGVLPVNPQGFSGAHAPSGATAMTPDLAFNTAVSFVTNTNWQSYVGETTLSYLVQMAGLTVQNFASAAAGIAIAVAVIRGFARQQASSLGNFWVDLVRGTLYLLLPLSLVGALFLCSQGVIQNLSPYTQVTTVEGKTQVLAQGPVASQEAIKMIGTNGGGFFNANSAHPFENPTPLTNFVQMLMIFIIPAGLTYTFGRMVGDTRQGWALFAAMSLLFFAGVFALYASEQAGNPILAKMGIQTAATANQPGGNMEGKEVRFGIAATALFATITTDASCGAVNGMHDSFTPLGGLVPLFNLHLGEVIFGGVGAGLYGMLLFAIVAVFIAGLMVGRTPEYLGKKIESKEVKMAMLAMLATSAAILLFSGITAVIQFPKDAYWNGSYGPGVGNLNNSGPHGLAEILYAYSSGAANNGSAFAGISANTPWYNLTIGLAMLVGRFLMIIPLMAAAGSLAAKKRVPVTSGTFPTHGPLFVGLLAGTVVIVGALTFFPALSLTPIVEHFLMQQGRLF
ncbi:potassium-transporting ATPase subunit KdpA [Paludibaculum fermentans]|uniref:Potassium-transporting ATPase potassium-binding subunit n=1 Tax=Paludibaculum fermentans TaxID=1473598 RepID=A0A7S7NNR1_PALFE|nr:potassium-transporting ATPase subunit KdpA [Paludibaculum fermentans]QOY86925.1 potassium-transporting ATPase subunit KdpA [Paludibaculum fermentans]